MKIHNQDFTQDVLGFIEATISRDPGLSRTQLSRKVCEYLDWRNGVGELKEMSCRLALLKLERKGLIRLPASGTQPRCAPSPFDACEAIAAEAPALHCSLHELGAIELHAIKRGDRKRSRVWNQLMERYHYLGAGPLCGAQIRYLIYHAEYGYLGGLSFSASAWRLAARDHWIGWDDHTRAKNLHKVVGNSRFLILPQVRVKNLASHVLALCNKRLVADWEQRYGFKPLLVETFVEQERFSGSCYRAANWIYVGETRGRGRQDRHKMCGVSVKDIYVYPLHRKARERLCDGPIKQVQPSRLSCSDWAEEEFGRAALGDERRKKRLLTLARDFYERPQQSIPATCGGDRAKTKAAYRFFDHKEHRMDTLLSSHYEATQARMSQEKVVLAVQDTTVLTYSHPHTQGLGPIGTSKDGAVGLLVHDTLCFNSEATPLGLLDVQMWARDAENFGKKHRRSKLPIEQKESAKWLRSFRAASEAQKRCPDTLVVSVGDREADIYELFLLAVNEPEGAKLLVRAEQKRLVADGQGHVWSHLRGQQVAATMEVHIPRRGNRKARDANLEMRFSEVTLKAPVSRPELGDVTLWAVLAEESNCPEGVKPLSWLLLTTCEVLSAKDAVERLKWYSCRWGIEVYHRTLKSGCKIEERQLGRADRLESCLAIDMVVAWRIFYLTKLGREVPDVPCTVFFEDAHWKALVAYKTHNPLPPEKIPSLREMTRMVASLGGFLGRKGDGEPGTKSLWIGLQRLDDITDMWKIAMRVFAPDVVDPPVSRNPTCG